MQPAYYEDFSEDIILISAFVISFFFQNKIFYATNPILNKLNFSEIVFVFLLARSIFLFNLSNLKKNYFF
jgi:hypothetical protein